MRWFKRDKPAKPDPIEVDYFTVARSWADDFTYQMLIGRQRYKWLSVLLAILLLLCLLVLMIQAAADHTELVVVHEGPSGYHWVSTVSSHQQIQSSELRVQAELANYVRDRETYDPVLYAFQSKQVHWLSNAKVFNQYQLAQSAQNSHSPIKQLGAKGYRTVIVQSVLLLEAVDQKIPGSKNLAQVNFRMIDHLFGQSEPLSDSPHTALISWQYQGVPSDPKQRLHNWDGLRITAYSAQPVSTDI